MHFAVLTVLDVEGQNFQEEVQQQLKVLMSPYAPVEFVDKTEDTLSLCHQYTIGGSFLLVKEKTPCIVSDLSPAPDGYMWCAAARYKDISIEKMGEIAQTPQKSFGDILAPHIDGVIDPLMMEGEGYTHRHKGLWAQLINNLVSRDKNAVVCIVDCHI